MKTGTIFLVGAAGGLVIGGIAYRRNIDRLVFSLYDITIRDDKAVGLIIAVQNPSNFFGYPVPRLFLNVFDEDSNFLGSLENDELQWIGPGSSWLRAWLHPNYTQLGTILVHLLLPNALDKLLLNGVIKVGGLEIPLDTELQLAPHQPAT